MFLKKSNPNTQFTEKWTVDISMTVPALAWRVVHVEWWVSSVGHRRRSVGLLVMWGCSWVSVSTVNSVPVTVWCGSSGLASPVCALEGLSAGQSTGGGNARNLTLKTIFAH